MALPMLKGDDLPQSQGVFEGRNPIVIEVHGEFLHIGKWLFRLLFHHREGHVPALTRVKDAVTRSSIASGCISVTFSGANKPSSSGRPSVVEGKSRFTMAAWVTWAMDRLRAWSKNTTALVARSQERTSRDI